MIEDTDSVSDRIEDYQVEEQIGHLLRRAHQRASSIFLASFADNQITPTQFAALAKLRDLGEVSQNHLGRLTAMDPATIQGVSRRLIERGFIETKADSNDKRRIILLLTNSGKELIDELIPYGMVVTKATLSPLTEDEREIVCKLLKKLS